MAPHGHAWGDSVQDDNDPITQTGGNRGKLVPGRMAALGKCQGRPDGIR